MAVIVGHDADALLRRCRLCRPAWRRLDCFRLCPLADWRRLDRDLCVELALVRAARRGGAFFAAFFLIILVFLTVFLRLAVLVTVVFLRFALALVFVAIAASLTLTPFGKSSSDRCRIRR